MWDSKHSGEILSGMIPYLAFEDEEWTSQTPFLVASFWHQRFGGIFSNSVKCSEVGMVPSMSQNVLMMGKISEDPPLTISKNMPMGIQQLWDTKTKQSINMGEYSRKRSLCLSRSFLLRSSVRRRHNLIQLPVVHSHPPWDLPFLILQQFCGAARHLSDSRSWRTWQLALLI